MLLTRWTGNSLHPFDALSRELDQAFGGFARVPLTRGAFPRLAIDETDDAYEVQAELPGVTSEDLDVSVHGNRVTLKGERKVTRREGATPLRQEWSGHEFERSLEFPVELDQSGVQAELKHGILHLTLPKAPGHKPRKIDIVTGD